MHTGLKLCPHEAFAKEYACRMLPCKCHRVKYVITARKFGWQFWQEKGRRMQGDENTPSNMTFMHSDTRAQVFGIPHPATWSHRLKSILHACGREKSVHLRHMVQKGVCLSSHSQQGRIDPPVVPHMRLPRPWTLAWRLLCNPDTLPLFVCGQSIAVQLTVNPQLLIQLTQSRTPFMQKMSWRTACCFDHDTAPLGTQLRPHNHR